MANLRDGCLMKKVKFMKNGRFGASNWGNYPLSAPSRSQLPESLLGEQSHR